MRLSDLILAIIEKHGASGCRGRTRLQKEVYFLRGRLGVPVVYQPHYYGPYSAELAFTTQSLVAEGLVTEDVTPVESESRFEGRLYTYKLTADGEELVAQWRDAEPEEAHAFDGAYDELQLGSQSVTRLAVASKLYHVVLSEGGKGVPTGELTDRASQLGWDVSEEEREEAVEFLLDHKIVRES
jgi:hypothetical protein